MEEVGWCASPRGCGPRTDVAVPAETVAPVAPVVVEPDSGMVPPEMPLEDAPAYNPPVEEIPVENVHIESNGIAPAIQDATNKTIDHAIESFFSSVLAGGLKFLIIGLLLIGAFMLIKHFMKSAAVRAQEFAAAKQEALIAEAREHARVKEALATKEKIERARRKRRTEELKRKTETSVATVAGFSLEDLTAPVYDSLPDMNVLKETGSDYIGGEGILKEAISQDMDSTFAAYTGDYSFSDYSSASDNLTISENATMESPEKRSDDPFAQYL